MLWLRYVDDTFVMWKHGDRELQGFLEHLNGQCAEIQFTMEKETEESIPFLDVGESGRTLKVHMAEHRRAVKNKDPKNGIAMHVQKKQGSL